MTIEANRLADFVIDSIKREQAKTAQSGQYLDDGLAAVVELHDLKKTLDTTETALGEMSDIYDDYVALDSSRFDWRSFGKDVPIDELNKKQLKETVKIFQQAVYLLADVGINEIDILDARNAELYDKLVEVYDEAE